MAALLDILHSLKVVIKDKEQAAVAYRRVCSFFAPSVDQPATSECFELELTLGLLMDLIKTEDEAKLAMSCIAEKLKSLAAGSATSQKSDTSQHATSSSSPSSSAQVATSSLPAEAESTATIESEVPKSPPTNSAVSTVTRSQQSSASTSTSTKDTTLPPHTEARSTAPIKSEVSRPSSPTTAPADQKPAASAQITTSPPSTEANPISPVTSEVSKPSSSAPALSDISQSQQPSASAQSATSAPSVEAESNASIKTKVSPVAAPADQQPSASGQKASSPPSKKAESPAPVPPVVFNPSSTTANLANVPQSQQPSAPIAPPIPFKPAGASIIPNTTQSQRPLAPATAPQPSSARPKKPLYSADQLTPKPYGLRPTYEPDDGDHLPPEIAKSVGNYQPPSYVVLLELANHGGYNHEPKGSKNGAPSFKTLNYLDYLQNERSMTVQRDIFNDYNGWEIDIPRVSCNQYLDLYNSMIHRKPSDLDATCRKILAELEVAIVNRAAVYKWYESLPPTDDRVAYNPRHLAFLQMFEKLEDAINRYLHTGKAQLIRR